MVQGSYSLPARRPQGHTCELGKWGSWESQLHPRAFLERAELALNLECLPGRFMLAPGVMSARMACARLEREALCTEGLPCLDLLRAREPLSAVFFGIKWV